MSKQFADGDYIRVESSDRSGYNFGTIVSSSIINGELHYGMAWDSFPNNVHYYSAKEVEGVWEIAGKMPIKQGLTYMPIDPSVTADKVCSHEWAEYYGLSESFKFCKKCDEKRNAN